MLLIRGRTCAALFLRPPMPIVATQLLPIDTRREDMKENLKKSQLGARVMFLFKCPDETTDNRRLAKELVHEWSRHIFYDPEAEAVGLQEGGGVGALRAVPLCCLEAVLGW